MKLTKEMLIDWIDRPPSNSDLDLINYIINMQNNRDKAIKKLNKYRNRKDHYGLWCMEYIDNADIIHTLKGDSE